jgi:hypothetical protein
MLIFFRVHLLFLQLLWTKNLKKFFEFHMTISQFHFQPYNI